MKKLLLSVAFLSLLNCTKDNANNAILPKGTKCTIRSGVFASGVYQPTPPVIVDDVYQQNSGSIMYDVTDSKNIIWQIPGNDLQVIN